jgi:hypothetical protein
MAEEVCPSKKVPIVSYKHKNHPTIDGVITPPKVTRELLDIFPKLPFRSGDVVINTYPKSGIVVDPSIYYMLYIYTLNI